MHNEHHLVLFVGQAPGRPWPADTVRATTQRSSDRLAGIVGLTKNELFARAVWVNLLPKFPGKHGAGDAFPLPAARRAAAALPLAPTTILLGSNVARAFSLPSALFCWHAVRGCRLAVVPHPSGISRAWNDARLVARARAFLRQALGIPAE